MTRLLVCRVGWMQFYRPRARLSQNYRIVRAEGQRGPWKVTITAYHYTLEESDGREVISFQ